MNLPPQIADFVPPDDARCEEERRNREGGENDAFALELHGDCRITFHAWAVWRLAGSSCCVSIKCLSYQPILASTLFCTSAPTLAGSGSPTHSKVIRDPPYRGPRFLRFDVSENYASAFRQIHTG
jgi:hypothetical protein